jgi:hypothetical protein
MHSIFHYVETVPHVSNGGITELSGACFNSRVCHLGLQLVTGVDLDSEDTDSELQC